MSLLAIVLIFLNLEVFLVFRRECVHLRRSIIETESSLRIVKGLRFLVVKLLLLLMLHRIKMRKHPTSVILSSVKILKAHLIGHLGTAERRLRAACIVVSWLAC